VKSILFQFDFGRVMAVQTRISGVDKPRRFDWP